MGDRRIQFHYSDIWEKMSDEEKKEAAEAQPIFAKERNNYKKRIENLRCFVSSQAFVYTWNLLNYIK